jgi:hypothetical protein
VLRRSGFLLLFAASLFAFSASGDEVFQVHVAPRLPTTVTPIEFRFPTYCGDEVSSITRTGPVITIRYGSFLCNPPFPHMARVPLPEKALPAGQYRVDFVAVGNPPHPRQRARFGDLHSSSRRAATVAGPPLDLPAATLARVDVRVDGPAEALTWGFITVTNNATQQVTTVTPQQ